MRILETKVYKFGELDDKAKEKALQWWAEGYDYGWGGEAVDSLKAFVDLFGVRIVDYSLDYGGPSSIRLRVPDDLEDLKGNRLRTWIVNHVDAKLLKGAYGLTGFCFDEDLLGPVNAFLKNPGKAVALEDLIKDGFYILAKSVASDYEYQTYGCLLYTSQAH